MTPMELYAALTERLPASETRAFLRKVMLAKYDLALVGEIPASSGQGPR